jgi:hypothetical protein
MSVGMIMDAVLMGLLIAALWFGVRLDSRLKALKAGQEAFSRSVYELDAAAIRAHASLVALRADGDETQDLLHGRIKVARELIQKLDSTNSRSEKLLYSLDLKDNKSVKPRVEPDMTSPQNDALSLLREAMRHNRLDIEPNLDVESAPARRTISRQGLRARRQQNLLASASEPDVAPPDLAPVDTVVSALNEMMRTLSLPKRQTHFGDDELFAEPETYPNKRQKDL